MSDLYDSLEEGSDENKRSCDSLDQIKAGAPNSSKVAYQSKSMHHYPFYLNQNLTKDNLAGFPYFSSAFNNVSPNYCRERNFLPKIKNKFNAKDQEPVQKIVVDNQILSKQGLQLNNDGSFTKSPRPETEELPFISREYKDIHFVRQKLRNSNKRAPSAKAQNKNLFSFTDTPVGGVSMNTIISARKKKGSSEEILVSDGSVSSTRSKANKHLSKEQNLTDSMKEKLLHQIQTPRGNVDNVKAIGNRNAKREFNVLEGNPQNSKTWRFKNEGSECPSFLPKERLRRSSNVDGENEVGMKTRSVERRIPRYRSDFAVSMGKPKLSYSERRQLQIGYNPVYLRLANKKAPADTNRSNFGDSTMEQLSGISTRIQSVENLMDENEETYYRKLIEADRNRQKRTARSSRSEGPIEFINLKDVGSSPYKKEKKKVTEVKLTGKGNPKLKHISKSLSLDMPVKPDCPNKFLPKNSHLCVGGSAMTWSKAELALKAKTYGYMVNARNIFKLKAKSDVKSCADKSPGRSRKSKSEKICPQPIHPLDFLSARKNILKRTSLTENSFSRMSRESFGGSQDYSKLRRSPPRVKPADGYKENHKNLALPEVQNLSSRGIKMKAEMLEGMNYYLKSPKR